MSQIKIKRGDYDPHESEIQIDKPKITGNVIAHYNRICPDSPALVFCVTIKHAEDVAAEFNAAGIRAAHLSGKLSDSVRKYRVTGLSSGEFKILTSCDIVSEGTDIPIVGSAILLRPTASFGLCRQQIGRVLRPYPGKTHAVILDHVGNCLRHGLPDEPHIWSLDGEKRTARKNAMNQNLKTCHICYAVFGSWMIRCPQCGADIETKNRVIDIVDGELILQNIAASEEIARIKREKRIEQGRAESLDDLLEIARQRGYKPGWAYILWNKKKARTRKNNVLQESMVV
jgi:superfamily II DNA or RNA helicase